MGLGAIKGDTRSLDYSSCIPRYPDGTSLSAKGACAGYVSGPEGSAAEPHPQLWSRSRVKRKFEARMWGCKTQGLGVRMWDSEWDG